MTFTFVVVLPKCSTIAVASINPKSPCKHNKTTCNLLRQLHNTKQTQTIVQEYPYPLPGSLGGSWCFQPGGRVALVSAANRPLLSLSVFFRLQNSWLLVFCQSMKHKWSSFLLYVQNPAYIYCTLYKKTNYLALLQKQTWLLKLSVKHQLIYILRTTADIIMA